MKKLLVSITENGQEFRQLETVYNIEEIPVLDLLLRCRESTTRARRTGTKDGKAVYYKCNYLEIPCAFDIETTNMYKRTKEGKIDTDYRPYGFMYHWQMAIDKYVVFGRTWEEWLKALRYLELNMDLSDKRRLVIYVHNLPFEFAFFRRFVRVIDGFYRYPYKPLKVMTNYGIEFRDSLALSNMSLAQFCRNSRDCIHWKATGDLDYNIIRTAATPLSETEQGYCYNDVAGLVECIRDRMRNDTLASMPMTSTGYVRRDCRNAMRKNSHNRRLFTESQLQPEVYKMFKSAFRGGNTHANAARANQTITGPVYSYDITSSYPAVIMEEEYPVGAFAPYDPDRQHEKDPEMNKYCYIFEVLIEEPEYIGSCGIPYISISKCSHITEGDNYQEDNGRIRSAAYIEMTCLDIDLKVIKQTYHARSYKIRNMYAAQKGPLPAEFKAVVMDYFNRKTQLKGIEDPDSQYLYAKYKNLLNSLFGMTVTRLDMDLVIYQPGEPEEFTTEGKPLEELLEKFYRSRSSFLPYQWGVYITAHARARLEKMLQTIGPDVIYCDTDSIKYTGDHKKDFDTINVKLQAMAEKAGAYADNKDGKRYYLGTWDPEHVMTRFKTLGAKKYLYEIDGKEIYSTIAGVNKQRGREFFSKYGFDAFKTGTIIENSGHLVAYRNDDTIHKITVDHCQMTTASNLALVDDTYTLGVTSTYLDLLERLMEDQQYITMQTEV